MNTWIVPNKYNLITCLHQYSRRDATGLSSWKCGKYTHSEQNGCRLHVEQEGRLFGLGNYPGIERTGSGLEAGDMHP